MPRTRCGRTRLAGVVVFLAGFVSLGFVSLDVVSLGVVGLATPAVAGPPALGAIRCVTPGRDACLPVFSPDGRRLAMSCSAQRGLCVVELATGARRVLAEDGGVAFHARWNAAGDALWVRTRSESTDALRLEELGLNGTRRTLAGPATELSYAALRGEAWQVLAGRTLLGANGAVGGPEIAADAGATWARTADGQLAAVVTRQGRLVVTDLASGKTRDIPSSRAGAGVLYGPVAAPSGHVIVANRLGEGLVFLDLDRGVEVAAGEGTSPCWMPGGHGVICEVTRDDGHALTGSALVWVAAPPGVERATVFEEPGWFPQHPAISPDGAWLAFDTPHEGVFVAEWKRAGGGR